MVWTWSLRSTRLPVYVFAVDPVTLTSDSESEIFCDSVDSVEQLSYIKVGFDSILQLIYLMHL